MRFLLGLVTAALIGLLLTVALARADSDSDARAAVAIASASLHRNPSLSCQCSGISCPLGGTCANGDCGLPGCSTSMKPAASVTDEDRLEWRRFADGDQTQVMLWSSRLGRQKGTYRFPFYFQQALANGAIQWTQRAGEYHQIVNGRLDDKPTTVVPIPLPQNIDAVPLRFSQPTVTLPLNMPGPGYQSGYGFTGGYAPSYGGGMGRGGCST